MSHNEKFACLVFAAVALIFAVWAYSNALVKIAVIENCARLAPQHMPFRMSNDGCEIGDWQVKP